MKKYILSIDQGTTSSRAIIFDKDGHLVEMSQKVYNLVYPHLGWVEKDPLEIWLSVIDVINAVFIKANITMDEIEAIGIANQRETTIVWDKKTGKPVYNAIIWQSRQSLPICDALASKNDFVFQKTGLKLNPYFSASKIRFILDTIPDGQKRAERGDLLFGTVDTWLLYKLTNGKVHATDHSNASRTLLYNIFTNKWDDELLALFNIPKKMLPMIKSSSGVFGKATFFPSNTLITGIAGDQQASLFGHMCFHIGDCKNTYGTGCFMLLNTGNKPVLSTNGLLTTVAWEIDGKVTYALEGSVFVGGAAVQWLKDEMGMLNDVDDSEAIAKASKGNDNLYFVPAFVGLGTPYWDNEVRGSVFGLTRGTNKSDFVRATLEAIAYQSKDVIDIMRNESHIDLSSLKVDGGATENKYLLQFQSDILRIEINLPTCLEVTALGAAYLAGLATGYYKSLKEIERKHSFQATFAPIMEEDIAKDKCLGWKKAVSSAQSFKR